MNIIKILDDNLANKIAAGEVVEKCVSVVKELVENSVDAKATEIKVEIQESGIRKIKVIDNGIGMTKEDALLAFSRHATSKLSTDADLYRISSLGFRGEALASIAAVSEVILKTSKKELGTEIKIKAGKLEYTKSSALRKGTSISVNNLFFNTPARLKYLNSLYTELANIVEYVNKMAISNPNIRFTLISDGKILLNTAGSNNKLKVINDIYGLDIIKKMVEIKSSNNDYDIKGFISLPEVTRSNRNHIITLVNKRVVRNMQLNKVINDAYHTYKPDNRYPIVVLFIDCDPSLVDVNIHPSKLDVKFSNFYDLKDMIYSSIKDKLSSMSLIPKAPFVDKFKESESNYTELQLDLSRVEESASINYNSDIKRNLPELYPVGVVQGTYIVCQNEDGMYLIDQHAAKERINYEKYIKELGNPNINSISLLFPITFEFPQNEFLIINNNIKALQDIRIDIEALGINTFIIKGHPTWLPKNYEEKSLFKILEIFIDEEKNFSIEKFNENIAISLSCKLAIKANENISILEMENIINDLRKANNPYTCPHGRPTIIAYTNYELEKMFKRAQ